MATYRDVGYARLSHYSEVERGGISRQEQDIRRLSTSTDGELVRLFSDNALSASRYARKKRKDYPAMLDLARSKAVDRLIIYDLDRLLRIPRELEDLIDLVDELDGLPVLSVAGELRLDTPDGRFFARMRVAQAAKESDDTSRRLRRGFDQAAEAGEPHGARGFGYSCLGLRPCPGNGCCHGGNTCGHDPKHPRCCRVEGCAHDGITIIPREAKLVELSADAVLAGESVKTITRGWNTVSILLAATGHQPVYTPQKRVPWNDTATRATLTSPRLAGLRVHRRHTPEERTFDARWEPVLAPTREEARRKHEALHRKLIHPDRPKRPPRRQPFTGMFRTEDGRPLSRNSNGGRPTYIAILGTSGLREGAQIAIRAEPAEALVEEILFARAEDGTLARDVARRRTARAETESERAEDPAALEAELVEIARDKADGLITRAEWLEMRSRVQARLDRARAAHTSDPHEHALAEALAPNLRERWLSGQISDDRKGAILHAVFERVEILPSKRRGGGPFQPERVHPVWRH